MIWIEFFFFIYVFAWAGTWVERAQKRWPNLSMVAEADHAQLQLWADNPECKAYVAACLTSSAPGLFLGDVAYLETLIRKAHEAHVEKLRLADSNKLIQRRAQCLGDMQKMFLPPPPEA